MWYRGSRNMALAIRDEVIEELLQGYRSPEDLLGEEGLFRELKTRLLERALGAELTQHLGYEKGDPAGRGSGNSAAHLGFRPAGMKRVGGWW
jgi:putative transposase